MKSKCLIKRHNKLECIQTLGIYIMYIHRLYVGNKNKQHATFVE